MHMAHGALVYLTQFKFGPQPDQIQLAIITRHHELQVALVVIQLPSLFTTPQLINEL